jgi:hypothetical protein
MPRRNMNCSSAKMKGHHNSWSQVYGKKNNKKTQENSMEAYHLNETEKAEGAKHE